MAPQGVTEESVNIFYDRKRLIQPEHHGKENKKNNHRRTD